MSRALMILAASCSMLAACATQSQPAPPPAVDVPAPRRCDPQISGAQIEAPPPIEGSIVKPESPVEVAATSAFLNSMAAIYAWGMEGWRLAAVGKAECGGRE